MIHLDHDAEPNIWRNTLDRLEKLNFQLNSRNEGGERRLMPGNHIQEILFDGYGEMLRMDVRLESDQPCTYEITTHDSQGVFQGTVMKGNNISGPIDSFNIPTNTGELDQRVIGWHIIFAAPKEEKEDTFLATINFLQGDSRLLDGPISLSGIHTAEKVIIGFARFVNSRAMSTHPEKQYAGLRT